ncbi:DUF2126 domain-containing protein [Rhodococcus sp. NPDC003318]|uniref:transglutaminase family protein n=1 Tax=Rhodococcus sp. NPDC003318 TaxID=3364503 RepID=UPI0036CB68BF
MGIKVALEHRTVYEFDRLVEMHPHVIRLRPAPHTRTPIEAYSLTIEPREHFVNWQQDAFGNFLARVVFPERARKLSITVGLVADLEVVNPFDFFIEDHAEYFGWEYPPELAAELEPYLRPVDEDEPGSGPGDVVRKWLQGFHIPDTIRTIDVLVTLNQALERDIDYSIRMEPGVQSPDHTLTTAVGSCRDSAWLLVSILRQLGLAARFVSGYLVQLSADEVALDGPSGPDTDFTDLHAWAEVYVPGAGWIGLDPTSGLFAGEGHIPLSAAPHPTSAAAITGATGTCESTLDYSNTVTRIQEDPRVTLPYTDAQWANILASGAALDERAAATDLRLTVGGEPTFVSVDHYGTPEWTTDADGPHKRERASDLAERLRRIYAPRGLVMRGQGKWYPGEPLPRWQIALLWRKDGGVLWRDPSLLADPWDPDRVHATPVAGAHSLASALVERLGLPADVVQPAYEDPLARLHRWVRLPAGPPPSGDEDLPPDVDGRDARQALLDKLDTAVDTPAAWVIPLQWAADDSGWESGRWPMRRGRIVLVEGDSPAGLRLPIRSIAWDQPDPRPEADPLDNRPPLLFQPTHRPEPTTIESAVVDLPTSLVTEVRDGVLYVFLPPLGALEHFSDLVAAVEQACAATGLPVVVEGYGPPDDGRLQSLSITPDPGVIEVNVQPTGSFAEQLALTETLYAQARSARLGAESFDVDGTHSGTGGGNHITLGGERPSESPLLRRPDLLVSLVTYWQRHPSLSYLFSGRFIGPTSQAPRVDEGRPETLYELEIAFSEIARLTGDGSRTPSPWIVDRALRHLLTDVTGNTHRAEFCIDKLYSPDSVRGRLGVLELRGFEMPPHPRLAMVQSLLVRGLVARFWDEPLRAPLIRHGANLHGRHLLPHFVAADIADVAADLRDHGIDFDTSWLDPFLEFRFPKLGFVQAGPVGLELRSAIEPWNVLGEEATAGGTARYVDSSVERLQVSVTGADPGRYVVTCNGVPLSLLATDKDDVQVAGVRYRAWQPPSALHPTIAVHSPLVFDVVDLESGRSRGGCTYHVVHPGGRAYDTPPVNAVEAHSRRGRRFDDNGFTPGDFDLAQLAETQSRLAVDRTAPGILDLRRIDTART